MKKVEYIAFCADGDRKEWREKLETNFLDQHKNLTEPINTIRARKPGSDATDAFTSEKEYYAELHKEKTVRQKAWAQFLMSETTGALKKEVEKVKSADKDTIIVAAFPEFFWRDINDNRKHASGDSKDIKNYGKPFYIDNMLSLFGLKKDFLPVDGALPANTLCSLTTEYTNLIIFAGTVWWKEPNPDDHKNEKIYNSLPVLYGGKCKSVWTKNFASHVDGYGNKRDTTTISPKLVKQPDNTDALKYSTGKEPLEEYGGLRFGMDICLDFISGSSDPSASKNDIALSKQLITSGSPDVHVLIAGGMPLVYGKTNYEKFINCQKLFLRCDTFTPCASVYVFKEGGSPTTKNADINASKMFFHHTAVLD